MSAETIRKAASEMREYAARGIAWEPEWDGDYAADKGWLAPPVALAVADWLEATANDGEALGEAAGMPINWEYGCLGNAFAVARAHLGEGGDE